MTSRGSHLALNWVEQGLVPDRVVRLGIRRLLKERLGPVPKAMLYRVSGTATPFRNPASASYERRP